MKKKILFLSIALISLTAFSFAADAPAINKNVISSFNQQFTSAKDVKWNYQVKYVKAEFTMNDMVLFAYFNDNGDLLAVTRFISPNQLPLSLLSNLKKDYDAYWISDLFEIQTENGTSYYATLENADQVVVLKSDGTNGWNTYKREKRENVQ
jgi:hypothetical protein